ncbi:MAG: ATP-binding protein [Bryobacteraceae bacterium]|nr:ATP-binding protein [Bryobacteraceae bacterium]MDW8376944.1 ATP-binding protein [Bryobacterales bacterium]
MGVVPLEAFAILTARIFLKLIFAVFCILVVAVLAADYIASRFVEENYIQNMTADLGDKARMVAITLRRLPDPPQQELLTEMGKALGGRLTLVDRTGRVIADSEAKPESMANHSDRPEIIQALQGQLGSAIRSSSTLGTPFLYVAIPMEDRVLRLAVPVARVRSGVDGVRRQMLAAVAIGFIPAILLTALIARYVSARLGKIIEYAGKLAEGHFDRRIPSPGDDELGILARKLNETGEKLQRTVEQLQREHVELEKLERIRKDFVINVSHELRTPLASIQGYTETLLDGALHDPQNNVRFLSIIRQNAERLARLTADLMTLSRIELKTQKFQFAAYYVNSLITETLDSLRPMAEKKQIRLEFQPAPAHTEVFCDSEAVHQILSNLIDNAIKYTPEGGRITVAATPLNHPKDFVEISVADTGIGIPEEDLPRLFERFYRVDKARSRELGGTGLGLAIVKHLAKAMGGDVGVSSQLQHGSRFWFTLPVQDLGLSEHTSVQAQLTVS